MEKYNFGKYDINTFEKTDYFIDIPKVLVDILLEAFGKLPKDLMVSPQMLDPVDDSMHFSVLERDEQERWINKYRIIIKRNENNFPEYGK